MTIPRVEVITSVDRLRRLRRWGFGSALPSSGTICTGTSAWEPDARAASIRVHSCLRQRNVNRRGKLALTHF